MDRKEFPTKKVNGKTVYMVPTDYFTKLVRGELEDLDVTLKNYPKYIREIKKRQNEPTPLSVTFELLQRLMTDLRQLYALNLVLFRALEQMPHPDKLRSKIDILERQMSSFEHQSIRGEKARIWLERFEQHLPQKEFDV